MNAMLFGLVDQAICVRLTETLLHFVWEGLVIGLGTMVAAWLFRTATAKTRYTIHAIAFVLLALSAPITFLLIDSPSDRSINGRDVGGNGGSISALSEPMSQVVSIADAQPKISSAQVEPSGTARPATDEMLSVAMELAQKESFDTRDAALQSGDSGFQSIVQRCAPYATAVYLLGVIAMLGRLCFALWGGHRLRRSAIPVRDERLLARIREQASRIGLKVAPVVAYCERVTTPVVAGVLRPMILLPIWLATEMDPEQVLVILAHEMAHIQRFDLFVILLQRLMETVLFFHPVVWYVSRQLSFERENCCDDLVVHAGCESVRYASTLVRLAELCAAHHPAIGQPLLSAAAANGGNGSHLKRRVMRLLSDPQRLRLTRGDSMTLLLIAALTVGAIAGVWRRAAAETSSAPISASVALMTQDGVSAPDKAKREVADRNDESEFSGKVVDTNQSAKSEIAVRGVVLKPDGKPAAGAVVRAASMAEWSSWDLAVATDLKSPLSETIADSQGLFSIRFPRHPFGDVSGFDEHWRDIWKKTQIAASLTGFGPTWVTCGDIDTTQPLTLRLVEDLPLRGRVINLEGRPIAGISVKVSAPQSPKEEDLSRWIAGIKAGEAPATVHQKVPLSVESRLIGSPTAVTTDADGRFEIRGLGRERVVSLKFAGEQVAYREAQAATREMETLQQVSGFQFEGKDPVFGATFTFSAEPARTIEGIVKDAKTGELLPDVSVESKTMTSYPYGKYRVLKTTTDKNGRFRLIGMPKGAENELWVAPNDRQPYFMRDVDVPDPVGLGPIRMEIELHRGIWITGRVTDGATGAPVPTVRMLYIPFLTNEYAQRTPEFPPHGFVDGDARQTRFQSKADGTYRIVGLPGRAIVGAESILKSYRHGVGYAAISGPKDEKRDFDTYYVPMKPGPKWPNMMKEINPPADTGPVTLDFALDPGQSMRIHVRGPDGKPITGLDVHGISSRDPVEKTDVSELTVTNLGPDEERPILFRHVEKRIGRVVRIGPKELAAGEITVKLQPEVYVVGRLLDEDGEPLSGAKIEASGVPFAFATRLDAVGADADGRFRAVLIPGCRYSLQAQTNRREMSFLWIERDLTVEPGATKDLGTLKFGKNGKPIKR
jgi:beta-lactamase regulating signal transducer with metallopeptidase domain